MQRVTVTKRSGSLGMSIIGGRGQTSHPFGITEPGIFISKVITSVYSHISFYLPPLSEVLCFAGSRE